MPEIIKDVDLSVISKKKFRINGDNDKIIELNTSDLGIIGRVEEAEVKLQESVAKLRELSESTDDTNLSADLKKLDTEMRELVDYIFDYPVCDVCVPFGTMYDPIEGGFRYEHIIERLMKLYEDTISTEYNKLKNRTSKHTAKYTKKRRK